MRRLNTWLALLATSVLAALPNHHAAAVVVSWDGGSAVPTANWSDSGNWVGDVAPVAGDSLVFDGVVQPVSSNDFVAGTNFAGITIAATASNTTTLNGNSINLAGDVAMNRTTSPTQNPAIATPLALQQNVSVSVASGGTLNVNGGVSGGFAVTKTDAGLAIVNTVGWTHTGGLNLNGGTFRTNLAGNTTASLGTGAVSLDNNSVLELRSTSATVFNNALAVNAGSGKIDIRSNHTFSPASLTGTGALTLRPVGADNLVFTLTDMKGWAGNLVADRNGRTNFGLRLATAFVNNSMANIAVTLNDATFLSRQNGTNQPGTTVVDIGSLASSSSSSSLGGSAAGTGYFVYSIGGLNTSTSFAGNVNDGGTRTALRKVGTGELILAGAANALSGPSSVDNGKLTVNGALTNANLVLTVNNGGTLGGTGTIAGSVNVADGGTLAPGNSPGTITMTALTISPNGVLSFELLGTNQAVGGGVNDLAQVNGALTLDGTVNVTELVAGSFLAAGAGDVWRLINYTGALTDNGLALGSMPTLSSGLFFEIDTLIPGQVNLKILSSVAVPEASALLFGAVALATSASVYAMRRRRAAAQ